MRWPWRLDHEPPAGEEAQREAEDQLGRTLMQGFRVEEAVKRAHRMALRVERQLRHINQT